jgi:hypothetical protein
MSNNLACNNCQEKKEKLMTCGKCKIAKYCCKECQVLDWDNHKESCFDRQKLRQIFLKLNDAMIIRFVNKNTLDCRIDNLKRVKPLLAFLNPDWRVDVDLSLTEDEFILYEKAQKVCNGNKLWFQDKPDLLVFT